MLKAPLRTWQNVKRIRYKLSNNGTIGFNDEHIVSSIDFSLHFHSKSKLASESQFFKKNQQKFRCSRIYIDVKRIRYYTYRFLIQYIYIDEKTII